MTTENAVGTPQTAPVIPAPAAPDAPASAAPATAPVTGPVESPTERQDKRVTAAFIKQRQDNRDLRDRLAKATATPPPSPAPAIEPDPAQPVPKESIPAPAPVQAAHSIEAEEKEALSALGEDKDLKAIPGAIIDIFEMIDNSPRLARIYNADPALGIREAKGLFLAKAGISPAPSMPLPTTTSGGMGGGNVNLEALMTEIDKYQPGTKQYSDLAHKIDAEIKKK